jgi:hypothetical protein
LKFRKVKNHDKGYLDRNSNSDLSSCEICISLHGVSLHWYVHLSLYSASGTFELAKAFFFGLPESKSVSGGILTTVSSLLA